MKRTVIIAGILAVATIAVTGVSLGQPKVATTTAEGANATAEVKIGNFTFGPTPLVVSVGTTVKWTNRDDIEHTVTSGDPEHRTGRFDLRLQGRGASTTVRFSEPGVYLYFCDRHPSMRGEIRVDP